MYASMSMQTRQAIIQYSSIPEAQGRAAWRLEESSPPTEYVYTPGSDGVSFEVPLSSTEGLARQRIDHCCGSLNML